MKPHEELFALAAKLRAAAASGEDRNVEEPLALLEDAARAVGHSFSGSWMGYHSRVYYQGLRSPPPGAHFSQEWGLKDMAMTTLGSHGDWEEFDPKYVEERIRHSAGNPDLTAAHAAEIAAAKTFDLSASDLRSILQGELDERSDSFLESLKSQAEKLGHMSPSNVAQHLAPRGQVMTRDTIVLGQGTQVPPHISILAEVLSIRNSFAICTAAAEISMKAASHLERRSLKLKVSERIGTNVFIGHGRSYVWRDLKDFVQDRLGLPWDEFNRVPVAGVTNIARLSEMLDASAVAFLVMTAEDEMADGAHQARMNVVHEAGLFQGRLGFTKAIVLLEEGCDEFSNIQGLGQIRFPKGKISAVFEEIRRVLEREGLIE